LSRKLIPIWGGEVKKDKKLKNRRREKRKKRVAKKWSKNPGLIKEKGKPDGEKKNKIKG